MELQLERKKSRGNILMIEVTANIDDDDFTRQIENINTDRNLFVLSKRNPTSWKTPRPVIQRDERENVFQYSSFCSSFVITITDIGFNWPTKHQQQQENTNIGQIAKMNQKNSSSIKPQTNVTFRFYYRLTITRSRFQGSSINTPQTYQQKPKRICLVPVVIGPQRIANNNKKSRLSMG